MQLKKHIGKEAVVRYKGILGYENTQKSTIIYVGNRHIIVRVSEREVPIKRIDLKEVAIIPEHLKSVDYKLETT